jgi:hypothetical protein
MADRDKNKCAHVTCECQRRKDNKYCSEYCEEAEKTGVVEIGCGCEHAPCR